MTKIKPKIKILKPQIPESLDDLDIQRKSIKDEDLFEEGTVIDCSIENQRAERVTFENIVFENVVFQEVYFKKAELIDVRFINCDLSNMSLVGGIIHRAEFLDCKMIGTRLDDVNFRDVRFINCNLSYSNLGFSKYIQVVFEKSILRNAEFQNAKLSKVGFKECDMTSIQMSGTKLKNIDLSNSEIEGMIVGLEELKGAIVSNIQVLSFAGLLGVVIKE